MQKHRGVVPVQASAECRWPFPIDPGYRAPSPFHMQEPRLRGPQRQPARTRDISSLGDLRLALIAGERTREAIDHSRPLSVVPAVPDRADLLLVESAALERGPKGVLSEQAVAEIARSFRAARVPTAIWLTSTRDAGTATKSLLEPFDHVFAVHQYAVDLAADAAHKRPAVLMPAASPKALAVDAKEKTGVAYMGGYSARWSPQSRALIETYLRVSLTSGLRIIAVRGSEPHGLPRRYSRRVQVVDTPARAVEAMSRFRALIAPAPVQEAESVPEAVMDAIAARVRVIMPSNVAASMALPRMVRFAGPGNDLVEALEECTRQDKRYERYVSGGRRFIQHTHTYSHRLATVAAAAGFRVFPVSSLSRSS